MRSWLGRKIHLYNVTMGLYMLDWWERYLFNILIVVLLWFIFYNGSRSATEFYNRWKTCHKLRVLYIKLVKVALINPTTAALSVFDMNYSPRKIVLFDVTFGPYDAEWWERGIVYMFAFIVLSIVSNGVLRLGFVLYDRSLVKYKGECNYEHVPFVKYHP